MKLDLNFNIKNPDGTDHQQGYQEASNIKEVKFRPWSMKAIIVDFLIAASNFEKISNERAWNFSCQLATAGIIETDSTGLDDLLTEYNKGSASIIFKMNLQKAIEEAKKKSEDKKVSEETTEAN